MLKLITGSNTGYEPTRPRQNH